MHSVKPGPANQSYGLQVAALAGVPSVVVDLAKQRLTELETHSVEPLSSSGKTGGTEQLSLFEISMSDVISEEIQQLDLDSVTPRQAMDLLYRYQAVLKEEQ